MAVRRITEKFKRICKNAKASWMVLALMIGYSTFAGFFLGTSCLLSSTTGLPCPGCGSTRALIALLKGDFTGSVRLYPLLIPSLIVILVYFAVWLISEKTPRWMEIVLISLVILLVALYAARMLLMFPNDVPMTYNNKAILPRIINLFREAA